MPRLITHSQCEAMSASEISDLFARYVNPGQVELFKWFSFSHDVAESASGAWITMRGGRRILDFTGGFGVLNHGHNHPRILASRRKYAESGRMEVHKILLSPWTAALAHNVAQVLPPELSVSFFPNSGAEAVEGAVKLAFKAHAGKRRFALHSDISFHGKLLVPASVSHSPEVPFRFPELPHRRMYRFGDFESLREQVEALHGDVYAILVEPFSASSLRECSSEFLRKTRDLCDRHDIALVFDEVYTGWGKVGPLFRFQHHGVTPDLLTFGKSFGGGKATIAGYVARPRLFERAYGALSEALLHTSTFNGFGEECATALEAVAIMVEEDYPAKADRIGKRLKDGLSAIARKHPDVVAEVRGAGAHQGILLKVLPEVVRKILAALPIPPLDDGRAFDRFAAAAVMEHLYAEHGVLTAFVVSTEIPLLFSPSLIVTDAEIDLALDALDRTLAKGLVDLVLRFVRQRVVGS